MSENNLDRIYEEFGANICLFPFMAGFYSINQLNNHGISPCSMVKFNGWGIQDNSIKSTLNNNQWIDLRKNFVIGSCHTSEFCETCSLAEKNGGDSPRKLNNQYFSEHIISNIIDHIKSVISNDYKVDKLLSMDFMPSNYCNYECIMCFGAASSSRSTFEIKVLGYDKIIKENKVKIDDFYQLLETVEILNFTGGETLLQTQVHEVIDYLVEHDLAKNISVSLLTNASKYPESLLEKFKQFKNVFYMVSIDGIGEVIEYQRRGAKWSTVEETALKLFNEFGCVFNYVLTSVNIFSFLDFVSWIEKHKFDKVFISLVYDRTKHLSVNGIPPELKDPLLIKLKNNNFTGLYRELVDRVIGILERAIYDPTLLDQFIKSIRLEDSVSKKKLIEVVPEWRPYFG